MVKKSPGIKPKIHAIAGGLAGIVIFSFLLSTTLVEILGSQQEIAFVKRMIVFPGLFILVPLLALTGGLGKAMAGSASHPTLAIKIKRMKIIAAFGIVILIPSALALSKLAASSSFGPMFTLIQTIEILAGVTNLSLIILNAKDGAALSKQGY